MAQQRIARNVTNLSLSGNSIGSVAQRIKAPNAAVCFKFEMQQLVIE